jgi:signal transduction histidine kinase
MNSKVTKQDILNKRIKELENINKMRFKVENDLYEQLKYNKIRTDIWKIASENKKNYKGLIQDILNIIGPALNVSRACYNEYRIIKKRPYYICVLEWCEPGTDPSLNTKLPEKIVKYFIENKFNVLNVPKALKLLPKSLQPVFRPVITAYAKSLDLVSVLLVPFYVKDKIKGVITFDICEDKDTKPEWTEERMNIIFDFVNIISSYATRTIMEMELKESEKRFIESEKLNAIGQLAGGIAHDFNNQMSGIMGYADLIRKNTEPDTKVFRFTENIITAVKRASDLTGKLITFARKSTNFKINVDINKIINEVIIFLKPGTDDKIEIIEKLNSKNKIVCGDPSQLQNMLLNIGLNAKDAMPKGGKLTFKTSEKNITDEFAKKHSDEIKPGNYIKIQINDTGTGISKKNIKRMFEPFFTTKKQGKGVGLGLAAVFATVKNHSGLITVKSRINSGTKFTIYLPLKKTRTEK